MIVQNGPKKIFKDWETKTFVHISNFICTKTCAILHCWGFLCHFQHLFPFGSQRINADPTNLISKERYIYRISIVPQMFCLNTTTCRGFIFVHSSMMFGKFGKTKIVKLHFNYPSTQLAPFRSNHRHRCETFRHCSAYARRTVMLQNMEQGLLPTEATLLR